MPEAAFPGRHPAVKKRRHGSRKTTSREQELRKIEQNYISCSIMNFFSSFGDLPSIQTRKALLLLDLQNDFVRPSGGLHVPNTADFLDTVPPLVNAFRSTGDVIWVRSHYKARRELIDWEGQEVVVAGRGELDQQRKKSQVGGNEESGPVDEEAFLSTDSPRCGHCQTSGTQFPAPLLAAIDANTDTLLDKSDYSALQSQNLILSLRSRFVTQVYLCGSLSNVSVYATALDAVRLGFSVTLIEDCLGFRDFGRHEEAMRRMADIFGASGITTEELCEELDWQKTDDIARKGGPKPVRSVRSAGIESVLDDLDFKTSDTAKDELKDGKRREVDGDSEEEDENRMGLGKFTRARDRYRPPLAPENEAGSERKVHAKVRRAKRPDQKPEMSSRSDARRARRSKPSRDLSGPGDVIGEGDSRIIHDLDLPPEAFKQIRQEVAWQKMYHLSGQVPRLVAVQGRTEANGSIPIYRHPADESPPLNPFTSTVGQVRVIVERILGHPLNHVLIQFYRDGQDRISEHSDKTLDIVRGSSICNVSLGAQRIMVLRTKASHGSEGAESGRQTQRVPLPHESLFVLGERTNMRWLHGIRPDKRPESDKSVEERAYSGERISLTFRHIGTFLNPTGDTIWGQGAVSKHQDKARPVMHGDAIETERLIRAFGQENHATEFNWDSVYGGGFDVVNFVTASTAQLILGDDPVANLRARLCLSENSLRYDATTEQPSTTADNGKRPMYIRTDGISVAGDTEILSYLAQRAPETERPGIDRLHGSVLLPQIEELLTSWREYRSRHTNDDLEALQTWEKALDGRNYLGGTAFAIDDCSLWPALWEMVQQRGDFPATKFPNLHQYYHRVEKRGLVKATLEEM